MKPAEKVRAYINATVGSDSASRAARAWHALDALAEIETEVERLREERDELRKDIKWLRSGLPST